MRLISGFDAHGNPVSRDSTPQEDANLVLLIQRANTALATNAASLGHAAVPAGTLTTAQLSAIVRALTDQVDALTRQNNALIRLLLGTVTDITDT